MVSYLLPLLYNLCRALPMRNNHSGKRSAKELGKNTPMDATTVCKSAYVSNNGTEVVGTLENGNCRFDLKINECADIQFNHGASFYRGIDQDGMCLFSQEDAQVPSEPGSPILTKPKESIQAFINDEEAIYNLTDATYTYLDHLLNIDYYDEENDY